MTGRTHDLAAFTTLFYISLTHPLPHMSVPTVFVAVGACLIGGLAPDLDQPTADLWQKIPAGSVISRLLSPLFGGHRFISHSILGIVLFGFLSYQLLEYSKSFLLVDTNLVWYCFMVGFLSHLVMDTITKDGVPWFFPIPVKIGIPPIKSLRIKTGGVVEKSILFPGLLLANFYCIYAYHSKILDFLHTIH